MSELDFKETGFKCGIEVHQRLAGERKLFCSCLNKVVEKAKPTAFLHRRLAAVAGELGEVDPAAAFEAARAREFVYQLFPETTCLIECDDEPPKRLNQEALETALQIALLFKAKPLEEVHVMRKTVVDGSAVSGFQRTALVAVNGVVETTRGIVAIPTICLEEESAGIVSQDESKVVYRIDRQGIPLVEIATDASIRDGEHARETAEQIGLLLRATGRVQRGIGSIRQDLNISIAGGARCEVKGAQELSLLPRLVENEVRRQLALVELRKELMARGVGSQEYRVKDLKNAFATAGAKPLSRGVLGVAPGRALEASAVVLGVKLQKFGGLLSRELMPGPPPHLLASELSDYARAYAGAVVECVHSESKGLPPLLSDVVRAELACGQEDAWFAVVGESGRTEAGLKAAFERALAAARATPGETRRAVGAKTVFLRPLPGSARMYPETDVPPTRVGEEILNALLKKLPPTPRELVERCLHLGVSKEVASRLVASPRFKHFEEVMQEVGEESGLAPFVAFTLLESITALRRDGFEVEKISSKKLVELFNALKESKIAKAAVPEALKHLSKNPEASAEELIKENNLAKISGPQLASLIKEFRGKKNAFEEIMRRYRLRVDALEVKKLLSE